MSCKISSLGFKVKERYKILNNNNELYDFLMWADKLTDNLELEGFVVEDIDNQMVKTKSKFYRFWKFMRSVKDQIKLRRPVKLSALNTPLHNEVYGFLKKQLTETLNFDIITLREKFYLEKI